MLININQMVEDGIDEKLIFLASMSSAALFEKIAMGIKNPFIFRNFMASQESASPWSYAYAAGLISKADVDLMKSYSSEGLSDIDINPGGNTNA